MWTVQIFEKGQWRSWTSAANIEVISKMVELLQVMEPERKYRVEWNGGEAR